MFLRRLVEIDEKWEKIDGVVYQFYRIVPDSDWIKRETPYKEIPVQIMQLPKEESQ